jgi:Zn-dependent metalloprotease
MRYPGIRAIAISVPLAVLLASSVVGLRPQAQNAQNLAKQTIGDLKAEFGDRISVKVSRATNKVSFVRLTSDLPGGLMSQLPGSSERGKASAFLRSRGQIFGLRDPDTELTSGVLSRDGLGGSHLTYTQNYKGVPVFGGVLKLHFDPSGELRAANGNLVPYIDVEPVPSQSRENATAIAASAVALQNKKKSSLRSSSADLFVYRTGLAKGVPGANHLVWRVEVTNDRDVLEFVFVDAHSGAVVDQFSGRYDALDRQLFDGNGVFVIPPTSYPTNPFWQEGSPFPTGIAGANEIIAASGDTYNLFKRAFGRDSYDGVGGRMVSFFNLGFSANAMAGLLGNQAITVFGDDLIADDVVVHEWTHMYTVFTHGLVYAWQPGALNEAYSDIFGEAIDQLNGRGLDSPSGRRDMSGNSCSTFSSPSTIVRVNSPGAIVGDYDASLAIFGLGTPSLPVQRMSGEVVQVDDGVGLGSDGCSASFVNAGEVSGKIALIDWSFDCSVNAKVRNAELNGAVAVILVNDSFFGDHPGAFLGDGTVTTIPAVNVGKTDGDLIRSQLSSGVNVTLFGDSTRNTDATYQWLLFEDSGFGNLRDMWNPGCSLDPGRTTDRRYFCGDFDNGGVHYNSGIPNHTFALLVDGGSFNGQTIRGLGLTKALHIYYRAMTVYQVPFTDFADHAEALEASAHDLLGRDLPDLLTGLPSGERINPSDLKQLNAVILATELREPPSQCNFNPVLAKNPPDDSCGLPHTNPRTIFSDTFEGNPFVRWTVSREFANEATFRGGKWSWVGNLPDGRPGKGFFAYDFEGGCELPSPGQLGVLELTSPPITIPGGLVSSPHLSFDHWVALEDGFDGGQLMISVNGGAFQLVPQLKFIYNAYNKSLLTWPFTDNVRAGQPAFSGTDGGSLNGSWGTSIVDLAGYAAAGDTIRFRFDMSTDYCFGTGTGWYLDNVRVYACQKTGGK